MDLSITNGQLTIDATDLAPLLEVVPEALRAQMRNGEVRILLEWPH
jgi:hypothetical protein